MNDELRPRKRSHEVGRVGRQRLCASMRIALATSFFFDERSSSHPGSCGLPRRKASASCSSARSEGDCPAAASAELSCGPAAADTVAAATALSV